MSLKIHDPIALAVMKVCGKQEIGWDKEAKYKLTYCYNFSEI